jgi:hypothetical protein
VHRQESRALPAGSQSPPDRTYFKTIYTLCTRCKKQINDEKKTVIDLSAAANNAATCWISKPPLDSGWYACVIGDCVEPTIWCLSDGQIMIFINELKRV